MVRTKLTGQPPSLRSSPPRPVRTKRRAGRQVPVSDSESTSSDDVPLTRRTRRTEGASSAVPPPSPIPHVHAASTSAAPVPPVPTPIPPLGSRTTPLTPLSYDFLTSKAQSLYTTIKDKAIIQDRGLHSSVGPPYSMMLSWHWDRLTSGFEAPAVLSLVREFYCNLSEPVSGVSDLIYCRNRLVDISPDAINRYFGCASIPTEADEFLQLRLQAYARRQEILHELCVPGTVWKIYVKGKGDDLEPVLGNFPAKYFKGSSYTDMHKFIACSIIPSSNKSEVTLDKALVNFCVHKGLKFDLGRVLSGSLKKMARGGKRDAIGHPHFITALCASAQVPFDIRTEAILRVKPPLRDPQVPTSASQFVQTHPIPPPPPPSIPTSIPTTSTSPPSSTPTPIPSPHLPPQREMISHLYQFTHSLAHYLVRREEVELERWTHFYRLQGLPMDNFPMSPRPPIFPPVSFTTPTTSAPVPPPTSSTDPPPTSVPSSDIPSSSHSPHHPPPAAGFSDPVTLAQYTAHTHHVLSALQSATAFQEEDVPTQASTFPPE